MSDPRSGFPDDDEPSPDRILANPLEIPPQTSSLTPPRPSRSGFPDESGEALVRQARGPGTLSPDEAARLFRLQTKTGMPIAVLEELDLDALDRETAVEDFNAERYRRMSPELGRWLEAHPRRLDLVQDDLVPLSGLERAMRAVRNLTRAGRSGELGAVAGLLGAAQGGLETYARSPIARITDTGGGALSQARVVDALRQRVEARRAREQPKASGVIEQGIYAGVESIIQVAATLPASLATGSPVPTLAGLGLITGGSAYGEARDAGLRAEQALRHGGTQAAIEVGTELIPASLLIKNLRHSGLWRTVRNQLISENLGEQVATHLQDLDAWATLHPERPFADYLAERPHAAAVTVVATIVAVGGTTAIGGAVARTIDGRPAPQAALEDLGAAAAASRTVTRSPEQLRTFAQAVVGEATVSLPIESFARYWQEHGESPAAVAERLTGDAAAFQRAIESGADLTVPLATYATQIAATPHNAFFAQEARLDPQGLNAREEAALDTAVQQQAEAAPAPEAESAPIREAVQRQLEAALVEPSTAETQARSLEAVFVTTAQRAGLDPLALFERFPLEIVRARPPRRTRSRRAALDADAQFQAALADARAQDPAVDEAQLREEFDERLGFAEALQPRGVPVTADVLATRSGVQRGTRWWETPWTGARVTLQQRRRGSITFGPGRQVTIALFSSQNLSTFLHEAGHLYLELLGDVATELQGRDPATLTETQARLVADYRDVVLPWLGVTSREAIGEAQHEQWAEGWEDYIEAGQAPSVELRATFRRMARWLVSLYRRERRRGPVTITPAIRAVMDRLVATDEAIAAAQQDAGLTPLFSEAALAGLPEADARALADQLQTVVERATDQVQARITAQRLRERETAWQTERRRVREEVTADLQQRPVYRAWAFLARGTQPDGSPLPEGTTAFKLSTAAIGQEVNPEIVARLPRNVHQQDGVAPSVAAELFGYQSARGLLNDLATAPPLDEAIAMETDARMRAEHGDLLLDGTIVDEAQKALADHSAELFLAELRALSTLTRRRRSPVPRLAAVRDLAERRIGSLSVREIRPATYLAAARRARRQAIEAAATQDFDAAFAAEIQALLNHELYRAATQAQEAVSDALETFRPMLNRPTPALAKTHNIDLVHAARALLVQVQIGTAGPKDQAVQTYLDQVQEYDPELFKDLEAAISASRLPAQSYRELTYDQFLGLRDGVLNLWHQAKRTREMVIAGQRLSLAEVGGQVIARLRAVTQTPRARAGYQRKVSTWQETKLYLLGMRASLRRVEHWVAAIDGSAARGVLRRFLWEPVSDSAARYRAAKVDVLSRYLGIVRTVESSLTTADIAAPELDYTFSGKAELLHAILHTGNLSNLSKLLRGRHWGAVQEDGSLDTSRWDRMVRRLWADGTLTKRDYEYVQATWDLLATLKPEAQRVHRDIYGYFFNEITAEPIVTPFGTFAGGYFPAVYDPFLDDDAAKREDRAVLEASPNSFMFPSTGRTFTFKRVEAYARPLSLDLRLVPLHLDKVLRFVHLQQAVKDAGRLVMDTGVRAALRDLDPTIAGDLLVPWLQRAAQQSVDTTTATGWGGRGAARFFRAVRRNTGLQIMTLNVKNALEQFTGLFLAAVEVPPRALARALWRLVRHPKTFSDAVAEASVFMRTRTHSQALEIQAQIDDLILNPSKYEQTRAFVRQHGYILQSATQNIVDLITWGGAYETATREGATQPDAVARADAAVRMTQGSFNPEDVSRFEAGSPFARALSMFFSFFNNSANLQGTRFTVIVRELGLRRGAGKLLYAYALGFMAPAVVSEILTRAMTGEEWDEDEDGLLDDLLGLFFWSQARMATAMVPVLGATAQSGLNVWNDRQFDDRISVSPAVSMLESVGRAPYSVYQAVMNDGRRKTAIRDVLTSIGLLTGLPTAALGRPLGYLADVAEGREEPEGPLDAARGLVQGR